MININVPPMISIEKLKEMKLRAKQTGGGKTFSGKTFQPQKYQAQDGGKTYSLQCIDGYYAGAVFPMDREIVLGREPKAAHIVYPTETPGISRKHCSIMPTRDGQIILKDLGSSQGTYFADGNALKPNVSYRINPGECFYLASRRETYKVIAKEGRG